MDEQEEEAAIRKLIATWISASSVGDTARVLELMSDDVVFLMPGQAPMRGKAAFAAAQKTMSGFRFQAESEVQEVRILGAWAWCWTRLSITVTPVAGGATVRRAGNTLSILQKQAGGWVIVRDANMLALVQ